MLARLVSAFSIVVHRGSLSAYCAAVLLMTPGLLADARAQTGGFQIQNQYITGLSSPTAMAFTPDGRIFVTEQAGSIRVISVAGQLLATPFLTLPSVRSDEERGLLGIAIDPQFASNGYVYIFYSPGNAAVSRLSRVTANGDRAVANSEVTIFEYGNFSGSHRGGDIHFGPDGLLYLGLGDAAEPENSQSVTSFDGKIVRLNKDGSIPASNPTSFTTTSGATVTTTGAFRAIWAIGLRNPYRFSFHDGTGAMRINDVGAGAFEEVNVGQAGANYGWPTCEGLCSNSLRPQSDLHARARTRPRSRLRHHRRHLRAGRPVPGRVHRPLLRHRLLQHLAAPPARRRFVRDLSAGHSSVLGRPEVRAGRQPADCSDTGPGRSPASPTPGAARTAIRWRRAPRRRRRDQRP